MVEFMSPMYSKGSEIRQKRNAPDLLVMYLCRILSGDVTNATPSASRGRRSQEASSIG